MRLAGIFNHHQDRTSAKQFQDRIHVGHLPVEMNRDDCRHRLAKVA